MEKIDLNELVINSNTEAQVSLTRTKANIEKFSNETERLMTSYHC